MNKQRVDIDDIALQLHNLATEPGLQCWELDHIYKRFYELRFEEMLRDFKEVVQILSSTKKIDEWKFKASMKDRFEHLENERGQAFSYYLKASRSSMSVEYEVEIIWPSDKMNIIRKDYKVGKSVGEGNFVVKEKFELDLILSPVNINQFQRNSLFSSWFYRLYFDMKDEGLI